MHKTKTLRKSKVMLHRRRQSYSLHKNIKTEYSYYEIAKDVETRFDTSKHELDRPLPKGKNKKVIPLMKNALVTTGNIIITIITVAR